MSGKWDWIGHVLIREHDDITRTRIGIESSITQKIYIEGLQ